ncbi:MAG: Ig-like domain-containing protein [bacterium]|nr:Ig-like domain-containing protein [bacterium]
MKKALFFILCCMVCGVKLQAQVYCELDTVYRNYAKEAGSRIIQTSDGNFVTFSVSGLNGNLVGESPKFNLTKTDACGNVLWRIKKFDSCTVDCWSGVSDLFEEQDGNIVFSGFLAGSLGKDIRLYKARSTGELLWSVQIGDSTKKYTNIKGLKVSGNKYLFVGSFRNSINANYKSVVVIADTLGHTLFQDSFPMQTVDFYSASKITDNSMLLVGGEDTSIFIINMDTMGTITNKYTFPRLSNLGVIHIGTNMEGTRLFYFANRQSNNQTLFAHLDLRGNLIKDSLYNQYIDLPYTYGNKAFISPTVNTGFILPGEKIILVDSNLHIAWVNTYDNIIHRRKSNYSILSSDSSIVSVGSGFFRTQGIGNEISDFWIGMKSISIMVKSINIVGSSNINQIHGSLQLSAVVLPESAINKAVYWEINDTSKARITQTGLVTAKANGILTVTVTSSDGSNISAQKDINITNQEVGISEYRIPEIELYPNPASSFIQIQLSSTRIKKLALLDLNGKLIHELSYSSEMEVSAFANGLYLVKIETDAGVAFKKLIIIK